MAAQREPSLPAAGPATGQTQRPAPAPPRRRLPTAAWLLGSLLLHLALMLALVLWPDRQQPGPEELPAPSFEIVFEGGQPEQAEAEPPPGLETPRAAEPPVPPADVAALPAPPNVPPPPAPPLAAATPDAAPLAAVQPAPPAPVPPPPPLPPAPAAPPAPAPPVPAPAASQRPLAEPPPPPPPGPGDVALLPPSPAPPPLAPPPPPPPAEPLRETAEAPPPPPPPPAPAAPRRAAPRPRQQAALTVPPGALFLSEGLQLGRPGPAPGRPQARGMDLQVDPRLAEGRASTDPMVRVSGAEVGADWRAAFRRWLDQNMRYPQRAAELGESGTVRVQVEAGADGRVRSVRLTAPSVSPSLNVGTTFPFVGAQLPPFPPPTDPDGVTIDLSVTYRLIRR